VIIFTKSPCLKVEEKIMGKSFGISLHNKDYILHFMTKQ
jgi:hypothetical protein